MYGFARDDKLAELLRQATAFKDKNDWDAALTTLAEAKTLMLVSPVSYPAETWCKYPLYLQQAGRFAEAMTEFQFLLDDLERRARRDAQLDDPNVGPKRQKLAYYRGIITNDKRIIRENMVLAQTRRENTEPKLKPNLEQETAQQINRGDRK
jgi:tetratricopeptide (TPR) repeat protein